MHIYYLYVHTNDTIAPYKVNSLFCVMANYGPALLEIGVSFLIEKIAPTGYVVWNFRF